MDCKMVSKNLVRYLDEDLPPALLAQISDHLDHCYLCLEELNELLRVSELARQSLHCPEYRDGFDALRQQLRPRPEPENIVYLPRSVQILRSALTATAVAAAVALFMVAVGFPAIHAIRTIDAVVGAQADGTAPIADPSQATGNSLLAWGSQIRWAESLSYAPRQAQPQQEPQEEEEPNHEPVSRAMPATNPQILLPAQSSSHAIISARVIVTG